MMNNRKTAGEFSKVLRLISVLEKCNGKETIGGSDALISPRAAKIVIAVGLVVLTGVLAAAAFFIEPYIAPYITLRDVTNALMMFLLLLSLVLAVKNIVTVLYTADDLPVLLPMPFSAGQIVAAKLVVSLKFPVILSLVLMNAAFFGFGFGAGMGASYFIGSLFSSVLVPVTGVAVAALLTVVVFRVFGFIRNRDMMMVIGAIFTLALIVAYIFITNIFNNSDSSNAALSMFSAVSGVSDSFPNIAFMSSFMFEGSVLALFISIAVTAAAVALAMLAVRLFYLSTALSMQNTGTGKKAVTKRALSGQKNAGALKALTVYEAKNARRNPAYLIYGFAMTFLWPLFFCLPFVFGNNSLFQSVKLPFDTSFALLGALFLGVAASCFACGFNILPVTAFSREGSTFGILRTLPIDFQEYYKSKRNFSMLICSLGSVAYILILGIICTATGIVSAGSCWVFLYSACISFLCNVIIVNCMLMNHAKKPVFNWDSETEFSRKLTWVNIVAIVIGFVMYISLFVVIMVSAITATQAEISLNTTALLPVVLAAAFVCALGVFAAAVAVNRSAVKKAQERLSAFA